jgi:hypothetical protein
VDRLLLLVDELLSAAVTFIEPIKIAALRDCRIYRKH